MAKHPGLQVGPAMEGVHQVGVVGVNRVDRVSVLGRRSGQGDGVDGQVAPGQVFFQRDIGRGVHRKAVVAGPGFALGAGQGIFLVCLGVQKDGKVFAHWQKALGQQGLGGGTHHHPVAVFHGQAQQGIAHRTTHHVNLHGGSLLKGAGPGGAGLSGAGGRALQNRESRPRPGRHPSRP